MRTLTDRITPEESYDKMQKVDQLLALYNNFLASNINNEKILNKMATVYNNMEGYIVDRRSEIPRYFNGEYSPFTLPHRAVHFIREQGGSNEYNNYMDEVKHGIAIFFKEENPAAIIHETNHSYSGTTYFQNIEGGVYKSGLNIQVIENDEFVAKTGNIMDEGMTDAIAKYFYENNREDISKIYGQTPEYNTNYSGIARACEVLLGKNLSNKIFLDAYFGDINDLVNFQNHFDNVMKPENITFNDLLQADFSKTSKEGNVDYSDNGLLYYACQYQLRSCENEQQRSETLQWFKEKNIDFQSVQNQYEANNTTKDSK